MRNVSKKRKTDAKKKMNASKKPMSTKRRVLGLNSAKQEAGEWFYTLGDVETVVAGVLAELDKDPGAGITLEASDKGIVLNVTPSDGDEFTTEIELLVEGDETPEGEEEEESFEEEEWEESEED